jgi:nitroreductase
MEFDSVIQKRRSCNKFKKKKPSWKLVLDAIESANQAPFAGNKNNLKYLIVEHPDRLKNICQDCQQSWMTKSRILIVICSDTSQLENLYGERGRIYAKQHAGAAIENLLLKLTDLGLSGCWVGAYKDKFIRKHLKIPASIEIEAIIPIGYAEEAPKKKKKQSLSNSVYWESWKNPSRPTIIEDPDITKR